MTKLLPHRNLFRQRNGIHQHHTTLKEFAKYKHIKLLTSEPYHSQHNSLAKQANQTIIELACATFSSLRLKKCYLHIVVWSSFFMLNQVPREGSSVIYLANGLQKGRKFDEKGLEGILFLKNLLHNFPLLESPGINLFTQTNPKSRGPNFLSFKKKYNFQESQDILSKSDSDQDDLASAISSPSDNSALPLPVPDVPVQVASHKPRREIRKPQRYGFHQYYKPPSYKAARKCPEWTKWKKALEDELNSIKLQDVWEEYNGTPENVLNTTWVFKVKENCHGDPVKYKAQICVQGFDQVLGIDCKKTWAPTGKLGLL